MSRTIHINLLKNSEKRSSMPVRSRVMVPAISSLVLLCLLVWAGLLASKTSDLEKSRADLLSKKENQKSAAAEYGEIKKREEAVQGELAQLESYRGGRILFSGVLAALPHAVPETMQLTSLDIPPAPRPVQAKPEKQGGGAGKNTAGRKTASEAAPAVEKVSLKLSGLVDSAASVDALRTALRSEAFTNLIVSTEIPKGAFRISADRSGRYVFEVNCECIERVFK